MQTSFQVVSRRFLGAFCAVLLVLTSIAFAQQPPPPQSAPPPPAAVQPLSPQQLDNLVAPIALYPDSLLSQILVAAGYPLEIVEASQWLQQNRNLQGPQLVEAARQQNWDPSVQALVVFPDVLNRLNSDIRWTTDLGNAFLAQQADVMNAVQNLRVQASREGKLKSSSHLTVKTETEGGQAAIEILPADPALVYVPAYNPAYFWGPPLVGFYPPLFYPQIGFGFGFGGGVYIGTFFGGLGWGGWGWGPSWFGHSIYVNNVFFHRYGYRGFHGTGAVGRSVWAHNPAHRRGVAYPSRALSARFRGAAAGRVAGQRYAARRAQPANRGTIANRGAAAGRVAGQRYAARRAQPARTSNRGTAANRSAVEGRSFGRQGSQRRNSVTTRSSFAGAQGRSQVRQQSNHSYANRMRSYHGGGTPHGGMAHASRMAHGGGMPHGGGASHGGRRR